MTKVGAEHYVLLALVFVFAVVMGMESHPQPRHGTGSKHFVLVHGSCLGAWCWYKLAPLLRSAGHKVTALDLAASGIDPRQINQVRSISDYFQPLRELMASLPPQEKVILVGHSYGGLGISQAMELFPDKISVAVFVTALMPGPSLNISTLMQESFRRQGSLLDSQFTFDDGPSNPPTAFIFGPKCMSSIVFQLCPPEDLSLASMLVRPLRLFRVEDMSRELVTTNEKYGSVRRVYVVMDEDEIMKKEFQRWMIHNNPPERVKEISGSDHMVMLSKAWELWDCLHKIADEYH